MGGWYTRRPDRTAPAAARRALPRTDDPLTAPARTPLAVSLPGSPRLPAEARLNALLGGGGAGAGLTVAAAESCSGGRVADRITAVPGSSVYFLGSIVAYADGAKERLLGVSRAVLERPGAVSEPCARAMAEGARAVFGADLAVATTGIAGPAGATARKPVGLVYVALAGPAGTEAQEFRFPGSRRDVAAAAAEAALRLLVGGVEAALGGRGQRTEDRGQRPSARNPASDI